MKVQFAATDRSQPIASGLEYNCNRLYSPHRYIDFLVTSTNPSKETTTARIKTVLKNHPIIRDLHYGRVIEKTNPKYSSDF